LSCVSTWMGDRLGIRNVLDGTFFCFSLSILANTADPTGMCSLSEVSRAISC
jgi:hypothetical protein